MEIHPYQDLRGEWRWRLVSSNGRVMADSSEGYTRQIDLARALETLADGGVQVDVVWPDDAPQVSTP